MIKQLFSISFTIFLFLSFFQAPVTFGHGGGLDSRGGHFNRKTGVYHCHRCPCGCSLQDKPASSKSRKDLGDLGIKPSAKTRCPRSHPIKGNLTTKTGECIYHIPGGSFYGKTHPERCFLSGAEAEKAGCRKSKR